MLTRSHAFDIIVITAANEAQASSYRAQLEARVRQGLLREGTLWRVVTDPGGRRVGSGSSTLAVLSQLADTVCQDGGDFTERFSQHRILIAHSGGDARRIPAYAPQGKIFMPLPCDVPPTGQPPWQRHPAALFDLILQTLSKLPTAPEGEIIICAGDVLLTFNSEETNLHTPGGITGLGFAVPPDVGEQHGVYVAATPSLGGPVLDFLQKPSRSEILAEGAIDPSGRVLIDTGVFCIAPAAAEALLHAAGIGLKGSRVVMNAGLQRDLMESRVSLVDLYREVALALPAAMSRERYLSNLSPTNSTRSAQKSFGQFFDRLHDTALPFNVVAVPDGEFFHIGTTRELLTKFTEPSRTARAFHFENGYRSHNLSKLTMPGPASHLLAANPLAANLATVPGKKPQTQNVAKRQDVVNVNGLTLFNAVTDFEHLQVHGLSYIENTVLSSQNAASQNVESTVELGGDNVLVGLWDATALLAHRSSLPRGIGFTVWPVRSPIVNGQEDSRQQVPPTIEVPIVFGVQDDNKGTYESGLCRLLNQPIELLIKAGIAPEVLWPTEEERSIWTAKIWCSGQAGWDTIELLLNIFTEPLEHPESPEHSESPQHLRQPVLGPPVASLAKGTRKQQHQRLKQWRAQQRWSLSDLLPLVDHTVDLLRRHQMAATYYHQQVLALLLDYPNLAVVDILAQVTDVDNQGEA
ncbi:MAG: hypothetical protein JOZ57_17235, partial [Abitibacteriaceae bacterium]|nr:hypothetical protein [Abditibacteriaceae bacterium]